MRGEKAGILRLRRELRFRQLARLEVQGNPVNALAAARPGISADVKWGFSGRCDCSREGEEREAKTFIEAES
jgi:hypothetical protein